MKQHLLILHGALGSAEQMQPLAKLMEEKYNVHVLDFEGHGYRPVPAVGYSIQHFATNVLQWMKDNEIKKINILGYSMGGYVGMYLARYHPERVQKLVAFATKWQWTPKTSEKEIAMLNPDTIMQKIPHFATILQQRHKATDWKLMLQLTANMMMVLGNKPALSGKDIATISTEVLLGLGDKDSMVTLEETVKVYRKLQNAQFAVLPNCPHPIEKIPLQSLKQLVENFIK